MNLVPYRRVARLVASHRRRSEGPWVAVGRLALGLAIVAIGLALLRPLLFGFLDDGPAALAEGVSGVALRAGLVIVGFGAFDAYRRLLRGEDREVYSFLPVDPAAVATVSLMQAVQERLVVGVAAAGMLLPLGWGGSWIAWAAVTVACLGLVVFAWPLSYLANLLAVDVATAPAAAPALDAIRGANPREQAAFIYTPGVVLLAGAGVVATAAWACGRAVLLDPWAIPGLAAPWILGLLCWAAVPALARRSWFAATRVMAEIDGRWAAVQRDDPERLHVYLDWAVRFFPASWRRFVLMDLRHGWRARRPWLTVPWLAGLGSAAFALAGGDEGGRALLVVGLASAGVVAVAFVLYKDEPPFLRWWLPAPRGPRAGARLMVLGLWAQPAVLPAILVLMYRFGLAHGALAALAAEVLVAACAVTAWALSARVRLGPWLYTSAALVLVGLFASGAALGGWW